MAAFEGSPKKPWREICICKGTDGVEARGGSSITPTSAGLLAFGGADRNQQAMNDVLLGEIPESGARLRMSNWKTKETSGDVPQPRSGHACVAYGKHLFLFGGIDFAEESTFNDLYVLNLETWVWGYVGEAGVEIEARNSHSLGIISGFNSEGEKVDYLVLYGGASVEKGPLGDTFYAVLPKEESALDEDTFFVTWEECKASPAPRPREMHGTCLYSEAEAEAEGAKSMLVSGGRGLDGVYDDVWELYCEEAGLQWRLRPDLTLDIPRCSHGCGVVQRETGPWLCLTGGFSGDGLSDEVSYLPFNAAYEGSTTTTATPSSSSSSSAASAAEPPWESSKLASLKGGRFGVAACVAPTWLIRAVLDKKNEPPYTGGVPLCIFGGINQTQDFEDVIMVAPPKLD